MKELALKIYNIGKEKGLISAKEEPTFKHLPVFEDDVKLRVPSIDKAKKILGYNPQISLEEGLKKTRDWFWENKDQIEESAMF